MIPYVSVNSYTSGSSSQGFSYLPNGYPGLTHYRTNEQRVNMTHVTGKHTFHGGGDFRQYFRNVGGGGQTSGSFTFDNRYMQRTEDGFTPASNLGLSWAAFELGMPTSYSQSITQPLAFGNWYGGGYFSDSWRLSSKLTLTLGLRAEYETGLTERYNRVSYFNPNLQLGSFATDAQTAYANMLNNSANAGNAAVQFLQSNMPASSLKIQGGTVYPGANGAPRNIFANQLMWLPRLGWAYQLNSKTVFRGGYGLYYDTNNVLFASTNSNTFNSTTNNPSLTNDNGQTWNVGNPLNGVSALTDPFPALYNGQRFISSVGTAYGSLAQVGSGPSFWGYDWKHARQQRWRASVQHQFTPNLMVEVAYDGSYSDQIAISHSLSYVPSQFYNYSNTRNDAAASAMSATVPNPFLPANFADIQASNPTLYTNIINSSGFFTSKTIQVSQLIRALPQMNGLTQNNVPAGLAKTQSFTASLTRRFANGFTFNAAFTRLNTREATGYANAFNQEPYWRISNNGRPDRVSISGIYHLPFGQGRKFLQRGVPSVVLGGWEVSSTYQYQEGPMLSWSTTTFYNGNVNDICGNAPHTLSQWINTNGFVTGSSAQAASYQAFVFPQFISNCRQDNTNMINASVMRQFKIFREGKFLQIRLDALNATNHPQFSGPNLTPTSTQFGQITSQTSQINRLIEITAHIQF
jgi:hypothetical protein